MPGPCGDEHQRKVELDRRVADPKSPRPSESGWMAFIALRDSLGEMPADFLADRGQHLERRDPFTDEPE